MYPLNEASSSERQLNLLRQATFDCVLCRCELTASSTDSHTGMVFSLWHACDVSFAPERNSVPQGVWYAKVAHGDPASAPDVTACRACFFISYQC